MKIRSLLLLAISLFTVSSCGGFIPTSSSVSSVPTPSSSEEANYWCGSYQNPLFVRNSTGNYYSSEIADPCVVRGDDGYIYAFATAGRVLRSQDGCDWEIYKENIIPRPSWGDKYADRPIIWAPDVVKIGDQWIYYYSLSAWGGPCGIGYAIADDIAGPYTDQGVLFTSPEANYETSVDVKNSIDQQVIIDVDGSVYMIVGSFVGCFMIELEEDGMSLKNGVAYQRENKILIAGTPGSFTDSKYEGSWIFKRGDYWYYMGSTGTCCQGKDSTYNVRVGKSEDIMGPYFDSNGRRLDAQNPSTAGDMVVWSSTGNTNTKGPGHNSVIMDDAGDFWWYGHCFYEYDNFITRHLAMDKLLWDDNDMPYIEGRQLSYYEEFDGPQWLEE